MEIFPAHIRIEDGVQIIQEVKDHLERTADYSAKALSGIGLYHTGYLAGILHDMGKYTGKFRDYIISSSKGEKQDYKVNHSFCGVKYILSTFHSSAFDHERLCCEIIAFAIGSHHGQFDCVNADSESGFLHRLNADDTDICYSEAVNNFYKYCLSKDEVANSFNKSCDEILAFYDKLKNIVTKSTVYFLLGLLARIVLSALIEGDRRDTFEFMEGKVLCCKSGNKQLWESLQIKLEEKLKAFDSSSPINKARQRFSDLCYDFAKNEAGIYRLTLPTGAGKTLATYRYALNHAKSCDKKRILFVIPLLSIIEQNSRVIKAQVEDDSLILEHHSNVVMPVEGEDLDLYENAVETWDSPFIITTLVQFLNVLFGESNTMVRRMHSLCDSIIIIDEIQSIPKKLINMFNMAINFLSNSCGATVILCSATQPCFENTAMPLNFSKPNEIVAYDKNLFAAFNRTTIVDKIVPHGSTIDEVAELAQKELVDKSSLLLICNTKESAKKIYRELASSGDMEYEALYLSSAFCMKHREDIINRIKSLLCTKKKFVCVSTQVVEAGVDFSFSSVIRIVAGIDNITQAAGRCNRHGDYGAGNVYIVKLKSDLENLRMLKEIKISQDCTIATLYEFNHNKDKYNNDLLNEACIKFYYEKLFSDTSIKNMFNFPITISNNQPETLTNLLGKNQAFVRRTPFENKFILNQAFKTAGEHFKVFDEETFDVIVPYNSEAESLIAELSSEKALYDIGFVKSVMQKIKPYTIRIFKYEKDLLTRQGLLHSVQRALILDKSCYCSDTGLNLKTDLIY